MALLVVILEGVVDVNEVADEREVNELAFAGALLVEQSEHQSREEALCADHVADNRADTGGVAVTLAGLSVQAAHCNCADIVRRLVAVLIGLVAERSQRTVNDAGVYFFNIFVAKAELLEEAGLIRGNKNIIVLYDVKQELLCVGVAELDLNGLLAAVLAAGVGGYTVDIERELSAALAAGDFDFDYFCAVVGKIGTCLGAGCIGGKVKDLDAFKHFHIVFSLYFLI